MKRKALLLIIPFAAAGLAGCERANPNPPGPTPDPQCESATVSITSAGGVTAIKPGDTLQLTANVNLPGCTFSWSSSDPTVASVEADGLVTGIKAGDVVINYGPGKFNLSIEENPPAPLREISIADAIDLMDKAGDGKVVQEEVVVVGKVLSGSKKDSNGWNGTFEGNKLEFSSARTDEEYSSLDDCTIKVQCYLELYNGKYKIGYLPANVSPTGEKYNPKIISVQVPAGKEVKSVDSVKSAPASVAVGGTVAPSSVTLNVTLEDDTKSTVKATKVEVVTSVAAESVEGKAWYNELGPVTFNIKVVAEAPSSMKKAYEAAAALGKDGETEEFTFSGVVVGMRSVTNEYYIQDGAYGVDIYGPSDKSLFAVGKKVNVTSTLQNYSGLIETKTIKEITAAGDGVLPEAAVVSSKGVLDSLKTNVLAEVTGSVVTVPTYTEGKDLTLKLNVNGDEIPVFFKGKLVSSYKDVIQSLAEGDEVVVKKAVTSAHGDMQLAVIDGTEVSKGQPTPQKEVDHIEITGSLEKSTYVEGEAYSTAGLSVIAYYTEGGSEKVSVTISPEHAKAVLGDTSIKFSATYGGKPAEKPFDVTVSPKPAPVAVDVSYRFEELVKKDSPAMTADEAKTAFVSGLVSGNDVVSAVTPNNTYAYDKAIRVGSKNGGGTLEITTSSIVTKAVISAHAYAAGELNNITIGSKTITVTAEETEYEFDLSESNKVSISTDKRVLIDGIGFCVKGATPVEPEVVSVAVTPKTADLPLNGTLQMHADVVTKGTASKEVNWFSSDESKATVDANGLVTPYAEGEVTITAKAKDNADITDTAAITVVAAAQDVLTKIEAKDYVTTANLNESYTFAGKVYGTYSLSGEKEITSGWEVTENISTATTGSKTGTISYEGQTCNFTVNVIDPTAVSSMKEAYEAALALSGDVKETKSFDMSGVIVGVRTNGSNHDYYIQDGEYGIDVYKSGSITGFEYGKKVNISSTMQKYSGIVETKTIGTTSVVGDGVMPEAVKITSAASLISTKQNVLVDMEGVVETAPSYDTSKDLTLNVKVGDDTIPVFIKKASLPLFETFIKSLTNGAKVTISNGIRGIYNTTNQVLAVDNTVLALKAEDPEVVSVAVTPKTAELPLNGTLQMSADVVTKGTASKEVNWFSSDELKATVDANGLVTPHAEGAVTITAKAKDNADITDTAAITVVAAAQDVLTKIEAKEYVTTANLNESYTFAGKVYGTYSLSGEKEITSGWEVTENISTATTGSKTGTISYEGQTCNFTVNVIDPSAAPVSVSIPLTGYAESTTSAYVNENTEATIEGIAFNAYGYNPSNGQIRGNKEVVGTSTTSDANSNFHIYNTSELGKSYNSISLSCTAGDFKNNVYLAYGNSELGDHVDPAAANVVKATYSDDAKTATFDLTGVSYKYFKIFSNEKFTNGTVTGGSIKIENKANPVSITSVKTSPDTVYQNDEIALADVTLLVKFDDNTEREVNPTDIVADTSEIKVITATAKYGTLEKTFDIEVIEKTTPTPPPSTDSYPITLSTEGGTSASEVTVNELAGIKAGSGSKVGVAKVAVPKDAKKLTIYVAGWKGETNTLSVTGLSSTFTTKLTSNDVFTGTDTAFTLEDVSAYKVEIDLGTLANDITLSFTVTGGKRFVMWNASYTK